MHGDKLLIRKYHTTIAEKIVGMVLSEIRPSEKYVISVAGESGSGKSEVCHEISKTLNSEGIECVTIHLDDYFKIPPKTNPIKRREDISIVGTSEVKMSLLNKHIKEFKDTSTTKIVKPLVYYRKNIIAEETLECKNARVLLVDGTYTTLLKKVDKKIFLSRTHRDTKKSRLARKRDKIDSFTKKILSMEHKIIFAHKKIADIIVDKDYKNVTRKDKTKRNIKRICMLTVHGFVDPKPVLGKTDTGGQVTYVLELSKSLARKGIKVDIYTRKFQNRKSIEHVARGVRIIRIPCGGKKFIEKEKLLPYLDTFVRNMDSFIKKERLEYQMYHSHYWDAGYVAMKLTEKLDQFFVHTFHSLGAWKREHMGGNPRIMEKMYNFKERIRIEKQIYKKTRALVMTSTDMIRSSKKFYDYKGKNNIIIPAGVNVNIFRPLKRGEKEKKLDVPQNYIFWVGRFDTNKGLDYLLKGFAEAVHKTKDLFLVIGGGSKNPIPKEKNLRKELKKIIHANKLENRVFFTRHVKDSLMPSYYRKAKFFVLPSKFEPFGMTGAEAMACGTPLIVSHRAGIRKYLKNKVNCLVVNASNKKDLAWAYQVLNRNDHFRKKIAANGKKFARHEFSWKTISEKSLIFYNKLLREQ
ncbi:MAG: glycosyltransferase [Candidatus Tantalella remota]|nr:glycosyltransferase [Candidatus Tantalella remota]